MDRQETEKVTVVLESLTVNSIKDMKVTLEVTWGSQSALCDMLIPVFKGRNEYQLFKEKVHVNLPYNRTSNVESIHLGIHILVECSRKGRSSDYRTHKPRQMHAI